MTGKTKILYALEQVILQHGGGAVTVRLVCQTAGVNHGLVPHYFGNKEGMLKEGLLFIADRKIRSLLQAVHGENPEEMVRLFSAGLLNDKQFPKLMIEFQILSLQSSSLAETVAKIIAGRTELLMIAFGLERADALFIQSSIIGIQLMKSSCGPQFTKQAADKLAEHLASVSRITPQRVRAALDLLAKRTEPTLPNPPFLAGETK